MVFLDNPEYGVNLAPIDLVRFAEDRNRIALQMVKDMLDESSFAASPAHAVLRRVGQAAATLVGRLRDRARGEHPE
ncbi:hypothetical protein [Microbispora siamensis]|uniref:Uncharacterized protein n=1 Tax=Microbispora siamensis TaxID=564413 RepID=A0ABQ4H1Y2_9ACTN|nr:hypothetical protein [Microbispora siamensis]GIH67630.1 hypothetical protein Msi02_84470 [Microbispora siamensis]